MIQPASDMLFLFTLLGIVLRGAFPTPCSWAVIGLLLLFSLLPALSRHPKPGRLRRDRALVIGGLFLLLVPGVARLDLWAALPACGFLIIGLLGFVSKRRGAQAWSRGHLDILLAGVITMVTVSAIAGADRAIMAYLATAPKFPGRVDFLVPMAVWACVWFGLDTHLRSLPGGPGTGFSNWAWDRRHQLGLCCAVAALLARQFVF
jgi:putative effector of murein hydrolase LrgA (UPF0299 family)